MGDMDAKTRAIVRSVTAVVPATFVVTATGSIASEGETASATDIAERIDERLGTADPVIAAPGVGGLFLDDEAALDQEVTTQQVADAMALETAPDGTASFDDTFPSFTVRFGRYC